MTWDLDFFKLRTFSFLIHITYTVLLSLAAGVCLPSENTISSDNESKKCQESTELLTIGVGIYLITVQSVIFAISYYGQRYDNIKIIIVHSS